MKGSIAKSATVAVMGDVEENLMNAVFGPAFVTKTCAPKFITQELAVSDAAIVAEDDEGLKAILFIYSQKNGGRGLKWRENI